MRTPPAPTRHATPLLAERRLLRNSPPSCAPHRVSDLPAAPCHAVPHAELRPSLRRTPPQRAPTVPMPHCAPPCQAAFALKVDVLRGAGFGCGPPPLSSHARRRSSQSPALPALLPSPAATSPRGASPRPPPPSRGERSRFLGFFHMISAKLGENS